MGAMRDFTLMQGCPTAGMLALLVPVDRREHSPLAFSFKWVRAAGGGMGTDRAGRRPGGGRG